MITKKQLEAARERAKKADEAQEKAFTRALAAWEKYDAMLTEYYKQCRAKDGKKGGTP